MIKKDISSTNSVENTGENETIIEKIENYKDNEKIPPIENQDAWEDQEVNIKPILEQTPEEPEVIHTKRDTKILVIMLAVVILVFAISLGGLKFFKDSPTGNIVVNVDDQHLKNKEGLLDEKDGYMYNGFSFVKSDGLWWTEVVTGGRLIKIPLHFDPKHVIDIPITGVLDPLFNKGDEVYISIDPNIANKFYTLAIAEVSFNIAKGIDRTPVGACTETNEDCKAHEILSCENTQGKPVVELAFGDKEKVELIGTCIKITGNELALVEAVDRALYKWYGMVN